MQGFELMAAFTTLGLTIIIQENQGTYTRYIAIAIIITIIPVYSIRTHSNIFFSTGHLVKIIRRSQTDNASVSGMSQFAACKVSNQYMQIL